MQRDLLRYSTGYRYYRTITRMCKSIDWIRLPQERDGNVKMVLRMDRKHSFPQQTVLEMGMQII